MEWLREWIMYLAGLVMLFAVLETVLPDGDMKKCVRLVMGLVLIIAVTKPIVNFSADKIDFAESAVRRETAAELKNRMSEKERICVMRIYREKLGENIKNEIAEDCGGRVEVKTEVEDTDAERFGEISGVTVIIYSDTVTDSDKVRQTISRKFGVDKNNIRVISAKEEG